jgi:hypothetical protein
VAGIAAANAQEPCENIGAASVGLMPAPAFRTARIVSVPLVNAAQTMVAVWQGVRGSTVVIDSPASLSAIFD